MNQIRIAALNDLKRVTPAVHYMIRPLSIDADLKLTSSLLGDPIGLTQDAVNYGVGGLRAKTRGG